MNKALSIALLVVGVILLAYGISAGDSLASEAKEAVTGNPTDRSIWLVAGGAALGIIGLLTLLSRSRRTV
jgi:hypothetical protein